MKEPEKVANISTIKPIYMKTLTKLFWVMFIRKGAMTLDITKAPSPKPMTTIPVMNPFLSGNHLAAVATGVI